MRKAALCRKGSGYYRYHRNPTNFWPDGSIFTTTEYKYNILQARMRELAYLNKGITITLTDKREKEEDGSFKQEIFHSEEGVKEFVRFLNSTNTPLIDDVIYLNTEKQGIPIECAIMYNTGFRENLHSYVNNINTIEGGTHEAGFRTALTRVLKKYAEESKALEKAKVEISGEDFREGLIAVISVKVAEPQFEGQTKTKLGNNEVSGAVNQAVGEALTYYLEEHPKEAKTIVDKVVLAATARIAARKARESVQRKSDGWRRSARKACRLFNVRQKNVNCSLSRVTQQVVLQNKDAAASSRPFFHCVVRS